MMTSRTNFDSVSVALVNSHAVGLGRDYLDIAHTAASFVANLDLVALEKLGIARTLETKFWPAHTIVTYPFFNDLERNNDVAGALARIERTLIPSANIYVHIPFCTGICEYCAYARIANKSAEQVEDYVNAIERELGVWKELLGGRLPAATSLYLGGGTPTAIPTHSLARLLDLLGERFDAPQITDFERTSEVSPETVVGVEGRAKLAVLKSRGFSRISMGVQSFSDKLASEINRRHTKATVIAAIDNIREVGIENLNIDLIYGLPGQSLGTWIETLATAIQLRLPSITMHQLKVKNKSQLAVPRNSYKTSGWSQEESLLFGYLGKLVLQEAGYSQLGVYRFVRDGGTAAQYRNQTYRMSNLLGLGSSSYSFIADCTTYNAFNQANYKTRVFSDLVPLEVGRPLSPAELRARFMIFGLRPGVSEVDFASAFPDDRRGIINVFPVVPALREHGLIERVEDGRYRLSATGLLFANEIGLLLASTQSGGRSQLS